MNEIGQHLKSIRTQQGLSLKDVYRETGISDSKLSRIENGANLSETDPGTLQTLAKLYHLNLVDLYLTAGYLDAKSLSSYKLIFQNAELLNENERTLIQTLINMLTKERSSHDI